MRTTRKEVEAVFQNWIKATGLKEAKSYNDVGGFMLDYTACYGGYEIVQIVNAQGGQTVISGSRLSAYYFCQAMRLVIQTLEQIRLNAMEVA